MKKLTFAEFAERVENISWSFEVESINSIPLAEKLVLDENSIAAIEQQIAIAQQAAKPKKRKSKYVHTKKKKR